MAAMDRLDQGAMGIGGRDEVFVTEKRTPLTGRTTQFPDCRFLTIDKPLSFVTTNLYYEFIRTSGNGGAGTGTGQNFWR